MKRVIALIAVACLLSCATWQAGMRKGLGAAASGSEQAIGSSEVICKQVLQSCIMAKENPCPALDKCLAIRRQIVRAAIVTQLTAMAGYLAVDVADKKKAQEALAEALRLLALIQQGLAALR